MDAHHFTGAFAIVYGVRTRFKSTDVQRCQGKRLKVVKAFSRLFFQYVFRYLHVYLSAFPTNFFFPARLNLLMAISRFIAAFLSGCSST